jgi:hypothetical protein
MQEKLNSGALFQAKEKKKEASPDRTGKCVIECPHCHRVARFWIAGWVKESKENAVKYLSLAFNVPKEERREPGADDAPLSDDAPPPEDQF